MCQRINLGILLFTVALALSHPTLAASDTVLRAAYCMKVLDHEIDDLIAGAHKFGLFNDADMQETISILKYNRARLHRFVFTNSGLTNNLDQDALAIVSAMKSGRDDATACASEYAVPKKGSCLSACSRRCGMDIVCRQRCDTECGASVCGKTSACINPTWLPY
jgi:hypothetical protein